MHIKRGFRRRGAAAVEFALVIPIVLVCLFAVMDYGWYFFRWQLMSDAVFRGVRTGSHKTYDTGTYTYPTTNTAPTETAANAEVIAQLTSFGISGVSPNLPGCSNCVYSVTNVDPSSPAHLRLTTTVSLNYAKLTGGLVPMPGKLNFTSTAKVESFK